LANVSVTGDVPKNSDDDLWTAPGSMHLYFNMSGIQAREGYQLHVANAKLRLMKYAEVRRPHWSPAPRAWMDHFGPMPPAANVGNQLTTSMASPDSTCSTHWPLA
jgi:hypothetical protein